MRSKRRERGQSLVEFALVLPIFLVLVLAAVDFGWALKAYVTAQNSSREGARAAALGQSVTNVKAKAVDKSSGLLTSSNVCVMYPATDPACKTSYTSKPGNEVKVQVKYDYNYITPLGNLLSSITGGTLPKPLKMTTSTTMRIE